jgi:stress response protein YsnF
MSVRRGYVPRWNTDPIAGGTVETVHVKDMTIEQLRDHAHRLGMDGAEDLNRDELIAALTDTDDAMTRSEERLVVGTEVWETGRARLRKYVVTEEVTITVPIRREELRLEREPIVEGSLPAVEDPDVFGASEVFGGREGGVIFEVTLHQERPLVSTEIVPVERVRLAKVVHTDEELISGEVRKERIDVDVPGQAPKTIG